MKLIHWLQHYLMVIISRVRTRFVQSTTTFAILVEVLYFETRGRLGDCNVSLLACDDRFPVPLSCKGESSPGMRENSYDWAGPSTVSELYLSTSRVIKNRLTIFRLCSFFSSVLFAKGRRPYRVELVERSIVSGFSCIWQLPSRLHSRAPICRKLKTIFSHKIVQRI